MAAAWVGEVPPGRVPGAVGHHWALQGDLKTEENKKGRPKAPFSISIGRDQPSSASKVVIVPLAAGNY
ncbi:hypothetical protein COJE103337_03620 [Corynebacterium jeikeium]|jgi:hypothetical protein|nr:hypothetical protein HMPREF0297_0214 [Corynebacterium jeikeium ATCC 43734]OOD30801.1 hypothetical protein BWP03_07020 [Corynebacterium jeikeium]WCZ54084.1 hypothetical protein CJEIK_07935 [Corynebacterium jeikeium]SCX20323.1 hypothetical protein CJBVI_1472 [Corynebacterium jeikeium]SQI20370.1 Uncharacterised protein [Corynebacterium jeikeium]